jgi:hypothetical protein
MIPAFDKNDNLPKGLYKAAIGEIKDIFGGSTPRRKWLFEKLQQIIELAKSTGKLERIILWGSFVSNKEFPQDIDLLLIMSEFFTIDEIDSEAKRFLIIYTQTVA